MASHIIVTDRRGLEFLFGQLAKGVRHGAAVAELDRTVADRLAAEALAHRIHGAIDRPACGPTPTG